MKELRTCHQVELTVVGGWFMSPQALEPVVSRGATPLQIAAEMNARAVRGGIARPHRTLGADRPRGAPGCWPSSRDVSVATRATENRRVLLTIMEGMKDILDFESWAPRGARAFRLREVPNEVSVKAEKVCIACFLTACVQRGRL